jgi:hypothetical protein
VIWPPEPGSHASDVRASVLLSGVTLADVRAELAEVWVNNGGTMEAHRALMAMYDVLLIEAYTAEQEADR